MISIMIVEDERIIAEDIKSFLLSKNYTVTGIISSGEEAIKQSQENKPDIILMDIMLEGEMNGIEAANRIIEQSNIPVIFVTANADELSWEGIHKLDYVDYVLKPFSGKSLHNIIKNTLSDMRLQKAAS